MSLINNSYFDSQLTRIKASRDCADLTAVSTEAVAAIQDVLTAIGIQLANLTPLVVAPTNLSSLLTWATSMIAPLLVAQANLLIQQTDLAAKLSTLEAAIAAQRSTLGCS